MKKIFGLLVLIMAFATSTVTAHEGHDHDAPKSISAPKGGIIKSLEETYVEALSKGNEIKIYIYDKELKPKSTTGFVLTAEIELPRKKKKEKVLLSTKDNFFEASYAAKEAHRYTLHLAIKDPKTDHDDQLKFTIEPKK